MRITNTWLDLWQYVNTLHGLNQHLHEHNKLRHAALLKSLRQSLVAVAQGLYKEIIKWLHVQYLKQTFVKLHTVVYTSSNHIACLLWLVIELYTFCMVCIIWHTLSHVIASQDEFWDLYNIICQLYVEADSTLTPSLFTAHVRLTNIYSTCNELNKNGVDLHGTSIQ